MSVEREVERLRMEERTRALVLPLNACGYSRIIVTKYFFPVSGE